MKIFSYNLNGLRSALQKGLEEWIREEDPDILCVQEIKLQDNQINKMIFEDLGYHQFWFAAEKKGYSGVGILSKIKPDKLEYGMGISKFDKEGRLIRMDIGDISLINSYFPSGTTGNIRQDFKMEFLDAIMEYLDNLLKVRPKVLICGDFNIAHKPFDINHPGRHKKTSGFLPEERDWMDRFIEAGFIDTFREFDERQGQYSWWSYRANSREKDLGWRIDYHFVSSALREKLTGAGIKKDVIHSDHCPVVVFLR